MINTTLTLKQKEVLKFIYEQIRFKQLAPTIREIGSHFKFSSTGTVRDHLAALVNKGYIRIQEGKSRAIELVKEALFQVPVLGRVQAGQPVYAAEDLLGYLNLDQFVFPEPDVFALKVRGLSMRDAGIIDGDFVLIRKQDHARPGDIVVALIGEEATVKRLAQRGSHLFLDPANPDFSPIALTSEASIIGKVLQVVRDYN
ncbi:MAG: repressor LexA [Elusimicrobia bacterium RIFOXYB2_FULL_49_7]|nr:MAG: repressor LexA [Elusimicrobia bacterium RIFOXYB2_FULL_49_7]